MSETPLKPCPFCGAEAQMLGGPMAQDRYQVWCKSQGERHHINGTMDADQTAAIWNTRADAAEIAALQARVDALVEAAKGLGRWCVNELPPHPDLTPLLESLDAAITAARVEP